MKYLLLLLLALPNSARAWSQLSANDMLYTSSYTVSSLMVGTTTVPIDAIFAVAATTNSPGAYVVRISSADGTVLMAVTQSGHFGSLGKKPSLTSCGSSTLDNFATDQDGVVTVTGTALASCVLTFAVPHSQYAHCVATSGSTLFFAAVTTQALTGPTISFSTSLTSGSFVYSCKGL